MSSFVFQSQIQSFHSIPYNTTDSSCASAFCCRELLFLYSYLAEAAAVEKGKSDARKLCSFGRLYVSAFSLSHSLSTKTKRGKKKTNNTLLSREYNK